MVFKKSAATSLDRARAALDDTNKKLAELGRVRATRLLAGDAASEIVKLDPRLRHCNTPRAPRPIAFGCSKARLRTRKPRRW